MIYSTFYKNAEKYNRYTIHRTHLLYFFQFILYLYMQYNSAIITQSQPCIMETNMLNFFKKKNKASFVFFIITLYSFLGFGIGYVIWEYFLNI